MKLETLNAILILLKKVAEDKSKVDPEALNYLVNEIIATLDEIRNPL